jgi:NAD(P)-dependent dehydrogenase (short-subunit alcohol dehydrogenase family)
MNAVVTGASRGIGAAAAERLAAEGANVAIVARSPQAAAAHPYIVGVDGEALHPAGTLDDTERRIAAYGTAVVKLYADMGDPAGRRAVIPDAVSALGGPVDILVSNAAMSFQATPLEYTREQRNRMWEVCFNAPMDMAQQVVPSMRERHRGWIVNVSSHQAVNRMPVGTTPNPFQLGQAMYGAVKSALNHMTNAMGAELYGSGVRVNTVAPRSAVMSEGAELILTEWGMYGQGEGRDRITEDVIESMEAMVEGLLVLCDCDESRTGQICDSLDLLDETDRTVMTLDGRRPYPGGQRRWRG